MEKPIRRDRTPQRNRFAPNNTGQYGRKAGFTSSNIQKFKLHGSVGTAGDCSSLIQRALLTNERFELKLLQPKEN